MKIKVDIFSGFLGAGKTRLIKKLIDESFNTEKIVVIENEFGDIGIDGNFLKKYDIRVKEINAGCICCSISNNFKNVLQEIVTSEGIERIIIEPSGVGKLSEIIKVVKELEPINQVFLNMVITVVDVTMYEDYIDLFSDFYKDQIAYANTIILSRTQNLSYEENQKVILKIKLINKKANIITTPWNKLISDNVVEKAKQHQIFNLIKKINVIKKTSLQLKYKRKTKNYATDVFNSWSIETKKLFSVETLETIFMEFKNEQLYGKIIRSKGILKTQDSHWIEFDYIPNDFEIRNGMVNVIGRISIIGKNLNKKNIESLISR